MKISEVTNEDIYEYTRLLEDDTDESILEAVKVAAKAYIIGYTGLTEDQLDSYEDITIAYLVIIQDLYDNRTLYPDMKYANTSNKTVETILSLHARNLL